MKDVPPKEVALDDVVKAFTKNKQVQYVLEALKSSVAHKEDKSIKLTILVTQDAFDISLIDGKEKTSIFEGKKEEIKPLKQDEVKFGVGLSQVIYSYISDAYTDVTPELISKTVAVVNSKVLSSLLEEIDSAIAEVWKNLVPKKG